MDYAEDESLAAEKKGMEVKVKFYGNYRRLLDRPEVVIEVEEEASPLQVVHSLAEHCGQEVGAALLAEEGGRVRLRAGVRIAVADEVLDLSSDLHRPLLRGVQRCERPIEVFIFPPLMGGR